MPSIMARQSSFGMLRPVGKIVWLALCHQDWASRTESSTRASGNASLSSGQKAEAGQSTAAW